MGQIGFRRDEQGEGDTPPLQSAMTQTVGKSIAQVDRDKQMHDTEIRPTIFKACAEQLLKACQEEHSGVAETPDRYSRAMMEMLSGYHDDPMQYLKIFENVHSSSMITAMGIDFTSFCEHHMLPFFGKAYIGYLPNKETKQIVGVSKLARILYCFTNRFQVQERIGETFCEFFEYNMQCEGVICVLHAQHMCMTKRGIRALGTTMVTSAIRGAFEEPVVRQEFLSLVNLSQKG